MLYPGQAKVADDQPFISRSQLTVNKAVLNIRYDDMKLIRLHLNLKVTLLADVEFERELKNLCTVVERTAMLVLGTKSATCFYDAVRVEYLTHAIDAVVDIHLDVVPLDGNDLDSLRLALSVKLAQLPMHIKELAPLDVYTVAVSELGDVNCEDDLAPESTFDIRVELLMSAFPRKVSLTPTISHSRLQKLGYDCARSVMDALGHDGCADLVSALSPFLCLAEFSDTEGDEYESVEPCKVNMNYTVEDDVYHAGSYTQMAMFLQVSLRGTQMMGDEEDILDTVVGWLETRLGACSGMPHIQAIVGGRIALAWGAAVEGVAFTVDQPEIIVTPIMMLDNAEDMSAQDQN